MTKVKLISHPYEKEIRFYAWQDLENTWQEVTYDTNANSQLISEKIKGSFFPFKVKEIMDIILEEYDDGEVLELEFQGTADEFTELENLVAQYAYPVNLQQSPLCLANAREILPRVVTIFERTKKLIPEELADDPAVQRFYEASNDRVPLLVLGNYSAGKSSLINALLGQELLPNSDSPATAKVVEISRVPVDHEACLTLFQDDRTLTVEVTSAGQVTVSDQVLFEILPDLEQVLVSHRGNSAATIFQAILTLLNQLPADQGEALSDLVKLALPGVIDQEAPNLVIFDTPGSNSSSNANHLAVLQEALRGMSNGLILFVTDYASLDTVDNHKLYEELQGIEALDTRFTLLVVNKADQADLSDFNEQAVLQQALPKQLYSEGLYFVSSIMGLGYKTQGQFKDGNYERVFRKSLEEFTTPSSPYYQQLYAYNILPKQLRESRYQSAASDIQDRLYANSGFLSLEQELETFAQVYSSYNKCQQSRHYLDQIIEQTSNYIADLKQELETDLVLLTNELERQKRLLIARTSDFHAQEQATNRKAYKAAMAQQLEELPKGLALGDLEERCEAFYQEVKVELGLEQQGQKKADHQNRLSSQARGWFKQFDLGAIGEQIEQLQANVKGVAEQHRAYDSLKNQAFAQVSDRLKAAVQADYGQQLNRSAQLLFDQSVVFWEDHCRALKKALADQIGLADELPLDRREALKQLIFDHEVIVWGKGPETLFATVDFGQGIRFGDFVLFGNANKLNLGKVVRHYDRGLKLARKDMERSLRAEHQALVDAWATDLIHVIEADIVEFNPNLRETHESILAQKAQIDVYQSQLADLSTYAQEIAELLTFKTKNEEIEDGN